MTTDPGDVTIEMMIDSLLKTPDALEELKPKLAAAVRRYLVQANAAGVSPDGTPYQRTQDGHVPLREGAKAIRVTVKGTDIVARVSGVEAMHSLGIARGRVVRAMLPTGEAPPELLAELSAILDKHMQEVLG